VRLAILGLLLAAAAAAAATRLDAGAALAVGAAALGAILLLVARGIASTRSSLLEPTVFRSDDPSERRVALSFDDGPDPEGTPRVLDALRAGGAKATFFLVGRLVRAHPDLARRIVEEGHEVGCHADSHARGTPFLRRAAMRREILDSLESIRAATGWTPRLYRPPFMVRSPAHAGLAGGLGLVLVGMARRGRDQEPRGPADALARRVAGSARGGEVLALHDGREPGREGALHATAAALPSILEGLRARGLDPVPVSALLSERPYAESPDRGWTGRSRGGRFGNAVVDGLLRLGGVRGALPVVYLAAAWFTVAHGEGRRASIGLRRRLHGRASLPVELWWCFRHFVVYGRKLLRRVAYVRLGGKPPDATFEGWDAVRDIVEGPAGFLLASAHFGDWTQLGRRMECRGRELVLVAARGMGPGPHQVGRDASRPAFSVIDAEGAPQAVALDVAAALRRSAAVAMLVDRSKDGVGVEATFLGAPARFAPGVWTVAMVTGAPVVVVFGLPAPDGGVRVVLKGPIRVPPRDRRDGVDRVREAVERFAAFLEEEVRRAPFEWENFHDFWRRA
jgi:peptidoglycan/xylan/chitin deacetylase (PgdA/CDA1 family)/predicted LPLAT superfamily acyltransferase